MGRSSLCILRTQSCQFRWKEYIPSFLSSQSINGTASNCQPPFNLWRLLCGWYHVLYLILLHLHRTSWDWSFHALVTHSSPSHSGGLTQEVFFLLAVHVHSESTRGHLSTWSCMMLASRIRGCLFQKLGKRDQSTHPHGLSAFQLTKGTLLTSCWPEQCDPPVRVA